MSFIGDLTGGLIGSSSAEKAAKEAQALSAAATKEARGYIDTASEDINAAYTPYAEAGTQAFQAQQDLAVPDAPTLSQFSFSGEDLLDDPSYQFRLSEMLQATDRLFGKNRQLTSGNRVAGTMERAGDVASTEYANAWNRAFNTNLANNATLGDQFQLASQQYGLTQDKNRYTADRGYDATGRIADYGYRTAVDKGNLALGHAANSTAADMFQAQSKSQFVSDLAGIAGSWAGAK